MQVELENSGHETKHEIYTHVQAPIPNNLATVTFVYDKQSRISFDGIDACLRTTV